MKYLKTFESDRSVQSIILSEINCIRHIVEDSGFIFKTNTDHPNFIGISITKLLSQDANRTGDPDVGEFEDRLQEICSLNGYTCRKFKNTYRYGYVIWHCFDSKKINRDGYDQEYE